MFGLQPVQRVQHVTVHVDGAEVIHKRHPVTVDNSGAAAESPSSSSADEPDHPLGAATDALTSTR